MTRTLRRLLAVVGAPRRRVAVAAGLGALTVVCGAGLMGTAAYLVVRAAERPEVLSLTVAIVGVRFFGLARPLVRYAERLASHDVALRALGRARVRCLERVVRLAPPQLAAHRDGDVLARLVADVDVLGDLHLRVVVPALAALVAGAACVGATAAVLPAAGLVLAAGLLAGGVALPVLAGAAAARAGGAEAPLRGDLAARMLEVVDGAAELAAYGAGPAATAALRRADARLVRLARRDAWLGGAADAGGVLLTGATVAVVLAVAVHARAAGDLDRALVAVPALVALVAFEAVTPLTAAARRLVAVVSSGERALALLDQPAAVEDPPEPASLPRGPLGVALEDVRARYDPASPPVLDGLSLRLDPGRKVALVGASGAGKSTVVALLLRFLDPEAGRVTIGGGDIRALAQDDVRSVFALAGQEAHVFATSIAENVRLGRPGAADADVERALRRARLWDWVAGLPDGAATLVGESGRDLSGGQRQRLVVARALLSQAPVLILDEPTAHLDGPTARALVADVFAAAGGRTVLLITHRPEGLELVDELHELDAGRLAGDRAVGAPCSS